MNNIIEKILNNNKVYVAGPISNSPNFFEEFSTASNRLKNDFGCKVMNPALLGPGFEQSEYMNICYKMIDACNVIVFIKGWKDSVGANEEYNYGSKNKLKMYEMIIDKNGKLLITELN